MLNFKILKKLSQNLSVLYVEDDLILREKTKITFDNLFAKVDTAIDGIDALSQYKKYYKNTSKYYDIVISDIQLPGLNGIELAKKILSINKNQRIVIMSAYDDKEYLVDLINIGVNAFMKKPISTKNMLNVLYAVCNSFTKDNILTLNENFTYDFSISTLFENNIKVELSDKESKLLGLLITNKNKAFDCMEIFNHLYYNEPEKEFSQDSIKSLIKRLRKKIPDNTITNIQQLGYSINLKL